MTMGMTIMVLTKSMLLMALERLMTLVVTMSMVAMVAMVLMMLMMSMLSTMPMLSTVLRLGRSGRRGGDAGEGGSCREGPREHEKVRTNSSGVDVNTALGTIHHHLVSVSLGYLRLSGGVCEAYARLKLELMPHFFLWQS